MPNLEAILEQYLEQTQRYRILLGSQDRPDKFTIIGFSHQATIKEIQTRLDQKNHPQPTINRRQIPSH